MLSYEEAKLERDKKIKQDYTNYVILKQKIEQERLEKIKEENDAS
jgi:hypothetical protein